MGTKGYATRPTARTLWSCKKCEDDATSAEMGPPGRNRRIKGMPDVPDMDFVDSLCEIRNEAQVDVFICRAHLAALFWQLQHVFESIGTAVTRGQKEHADKEYFWLYEKRLEELKQSPIGQEITAYRNMSHENPAIIGCHWESKGGKFQFHFLPLLSGYEARAPIELNAHLQQFFEFVVNVWFEFAPNHYAEKFPRDFKFPVTVPNTFIGELPPELKDHRQFEVELRATPST